VYPNTDISWYVYTSIPYIKWDVIYPIYTSDVYQIHYYTQYQISNVIVSDIHHWIFDIVIFVIPQRTEK
jgi:hypothetical protein